MQIKECDVEWGSRSGKRAGFFFRKGWYFLFRQMICKTLSTAMCHGSSLVALPNGKVLCAWFGGSREGASDTEIWFSQASPVRTVVKAVDRNGKTVAQKHTEMVWSEPVCLTGFEEACWNPVLFFNGENVKLFFKVGDRIANWKTYVMDGVGDPVSWTRPRELVEGDESGGRGPVRATPVVLPTGRICAGGSTERGEWRCFCDYSDDGGITWTRSNVLELSLLDDNLTRAPARESEKGVNTANLPPLSSQSFQGRGVIQPVIWHEMNSRLHMFMRSTEGYLYESASDDGGKVWTSPRATRLFNNNSGFDLIRTPGGRLFMACNPVRGNWGERTPLTLYMGSEDGQEWEKLMKLDKGKGEFSYPSLSYNRSGLWCSYTYKRENIAVIYLSWQDIAASRKFRKLF